MAFFGFGKKKETVSIPCGCKGNGPVTAADMSSIENPCQENGSSVKVLGAGCASCHALAENMRAAIKNLGLAVRFEYITDMQVIARYGVMRMPAVVVNEKVVSSGKVLKVDEAEKLLKEQNL